MKNDDHKFRALIENSHDGISLLGRNGKLTYVTPSTKRILGYEYDELVGTAPVVYIHPEDQERVVSLLAGLMPSFGNTITATYRMKHKSGSWRMIRSNITNMLHDPGIEALVFNFEDATERLHTQEQLIHANRLYAFISQINQSIVHTSDEQTVFNEVCKIAIEYGKFSMAWIGIINSADSKIRLVAQQGIADEDVYRFSAKYESNGPQDNVLRLKVSYVCNNIQRDLQLDHWKHYASARQLGSCMVLPLKKSGNIIGTFNLYSPEIDFFNATEIKLLEEAANDISFALDIFEKEKKRNEVEEKLKHNELRFNQAQAIAHIGSWELDFSSNLATWSDEHCHIYGLSLQDNVHSYESWISMIHPEDQSYVLEVSKKGQHSLENFSFYHRIIRKDGAIRQIHCQNYFEFDNNGIPSSMYGVSHDITEIKETEARLKETYEDIQTLLDHTDEMFIMIDVGLNIISFNKNAQNGCKKYLGKELMKGASILEYTSPERVDLLRQLYSEVLTGEKRQTESVYKTPQGDEVHFLTLMKPIIDAEEAIEGIFVIERNITEIIKNEDRIEFDQHNLNALINNTEDLMWSVDRNYKLITANRAFDELIKLMSGKTIEKGNTVLASGFSDEQLERFKGYYDRAFAGESFTHIEYNPPPYESWSEISLNPIKQGNAIVGTACYAHNITQSKVVEEHLVQANRMYAFNSQINQTIVHVTDEQTLFNEACRVAVITGNFEVACIDIIDETNKKINLVAQHNADPAYLELLNEMEYLENGAISKILLTNKCYVINDYSNEPEQDFWNQYAFHREFNSAIILPIKKAGKIQYILSLFSKKANFFDSDEITLLEEVAGDISFALEVFEKEIQRKHVEEELKQSQLRLQQAQSIAHLGSWVLPFSTGVALWSDEACRIYGLPIEENMQTFDDWASFLHPDDVEDVMKKINESQHTKSSAAFYHRIVLRNGLVKYLYSQSHFEFKEGIPIGLYGVAHDVTEQKIAEEKIINVNRLYSFISGINQTIVHVKDEKMLFDKACKIAIDHGKFSLAWIGIPDDANPSLRLVAQGNAKVCELEVITNLAYQDKGPTAYVLQSGNYCVINNLEQEPDGSLIKKFGFEHGYKSCIVLPIKKSGNVYGTLNLFSTQVDLFDEEEILLLEEVAGDLSFALDVFEKEQFRLIAEKNIEDSERRLKQAQAIAHVGNWIFDFSTGIARWSDEHCRIYGLPIECDAHTLESWISFIHPDDVEDVMNVLQKSDSSFRNSSFQHRIIRKDGTVRHLNMYCQFALNDAGEPTGIYGVSHDITESKEAQQSLIQSEANLRLIIDLIPQAIFVKDFDGRYLFVNKKFASLYGLTPTELINKSHLEAIAIPEDGQMFLKQDQEVMITGITKIIPELLFTSPTGEKRIFHTIKVPYTPALKSEKGVLGIANDITNQKKSEAERAKMVADIVQRNNDLEQFSYIVSHNLRTHVANILGLTQVMEISDSDRQKEIILELYNSVKNLDNVIKDLNHILQINHKENKKNEVVNFNTLLDEIKISISSAIKIEDVQIISDFTECNEMTTLKGYLYSVFTNLVSNSIKYRYPGKKLVIDIRSRKKENKLQLIFKDNGLGIDLEKRGKQVFGLYKRFHNHVEGKGMGLYMVKMQVESLGGTISIASEVNKGTEFTIEFDTNKQILN